MDYLADTVAIVRHLRNHPALGREAARVFHDADAGVNRVYLSAITLMEILYLSEAGRVDVSLAELVSMVALSRNYAIVPVDSDIVLAAVGIDDVPELHDRIIVATARHLDVPILTGDRVIVGSSHVRSVW
jgi:PIN domain nuclease of toxin-antitoxin system